MVGKRRTNETHVRAYEAADGGPAAGLTGAEQRAAFLSATWGGGATGGAVRGS